MIRRAIYVLSAVVLTLAAFEVSAQKYPERRIARQGTRLYDRGDFAAAEAAYRRALELNPELREATFNLGDALWRQENAQGAADAWTGTEADSLAPPQMISAASYNLGNVALAGQQIDAAIEAYKQSLRLNPDDQEAKFNLAYAQKLKQQQEQNEDQDQNDQNDQNNEGGGGQDNQNNEDQNDDQRDQSNEDGDGQNDPQNGEGDQNNDSNGDGNDQPPPPSGQNPGEAKIDPRAAEQMLDAMQAAEDDTREKVNAREVQTAPRSGKNW